MRLDLSCSAIESVVRKFFGSSWRFARTYMQHCVGHRSFKLCSTTMRKWSFCVASDSTFRGQALIESSVIHTYKLYYADTVVVCFGTLQRAREMKEVKLLHS